MIRILIADDHPIVRKGIIDILISELNDVVCGEASDAAQALALVQNNNWDLAVLDITMPGRSGLDVLRELKHLKPDLPVLMLSMHLEDQYGKRVLRAGASGYMNKQSAPDELVKAVQKILAGRHYVSPSLAEKLVVDLHEKKERPLHEALSHREFDVLRMLALGKTVSQIAQEVHLSVTTVSTYRARILDKMNMTTTAELMHYALRHNLVD